MSDTVTLALRTPLDTALEVERVTADRFADLSERDIAALPVWVGARRAQLGEFFTVRGERSIRVRVEGSTARVHGLAAGSAGGEMIIEGDTGDQPARAMIAGTLVVLGRTGAQPGRGSKRGSIIAVGGIEVPITYWHACTYQPPHVRLTMTYLRRHYGLAIEDRVAGGAYRRYCGDAGDQGRGEILEWAGQ